MTIDSKLLSEKVVEAIGRFAPARVRPMMGGYLLYVDETLIGQINEGKLFLKVTPFGERFAPDLPRSSPYPGAKPAILVPNERLVEGDWLQEIVMGTRAGLV